MDLDNQKQPARILLVEDNKIDARLTRHAFHLMSDWPSTLELVDDGEKAMHFLCRQHIYAGASQPDLVILDLNLPKRDGTEVLQFIRANRELQNLLVFIFSSSPVDIAEDRMASVNIRADGYFEKPYRVGTYFSIAAQIREAYEQAVGLLRRASA